LVLESIFEPVSMRKRPFCLPIKAKGGAMKVNFSLETGVNKPATLTSNQKEDKDNNDGNNGQFDTK